MHLATANCVAVTSTKGASQSVMLTTLCGDDNCRVTVASSAVKTASKSSMWWRRGQIYTSGYESENWAKNPSSERLSLLSEFVLVKVSRHKNTSYRLRMFADAKKATCKIGAFFMTNPLPLLLEYSRCCSETNSALRIYGRPA